MREITDIPAELFDPIGHAPNWGSYRGTFARVDPGNLVRDSLERLLSEKRWFYALIVREPWVIGMALSDLGYLTNGFVFALEHGRGMRIDRSAISLPRLSRIKQTAERRIDGRLVHPRLSLDVVARHGASPIELHARAKGLELHATLEAHRAPPAITAVAPIPKGMINITEKRASMLLQGAALIGGQRIDLDGATGGYDYTHGVLARNTKWNWAFILGTATSGERIAVNLVEGFVGEPECAAWIHDRLVPLSEGRFELDREHPERPWRVTSAEREVELILEPEGIHHERHDYRLIKSRFIQPVGAVRGRLRIEGRTFEIARAFGVVEDQEVRW